MTKLVDIVVPSVGESVTEIWEVQALKTVGDYVKEGETFLEGQSDKASVEIPSTISGYIKEILVEDGNDFPIGAVIARVEEGEAPAEESQETVETPGGSASETGTLPGTNADTIPVRHE